MSDNYMDVDRLRRMAQGMEDKAQVLRTVAKTIETLIEILRTTAFIGMVGSQAMEHYLTVTKPRLDQLAKQHEEFANEIKRSVGLWEQAQSAGNDI